MRGHIAKVWADLTATQKHAAKECCYELLCADPTITWMCPAVLDTRISEDAFVLLKRAFKKTGKMPRRQGWHKTLLCDEISEELDLWVERREENNRGIGGKELQAQVHSALPRLPRYPYMDH